MLRVDHLLFKGIQLPDATNETSICGYGIYFETEEEGEVEWSCTRPTGHAGAHCAGDQDQTLMFFTSEFADSHEVSERPKVSQPSVVNGVSTGMAMFFDLSSQMAQQSQSGCDLKLPIFDKDGSRDSNSCSLHIGNCHVVYTAKDDHWFIQSLQEIAE